MSRDLWIVIIIVMAFLGFLLGYSSSAFVSGTDAGHKVESSGYK
ncbi:MAG: hypothetical protein OEY64_03450 [Nitrospinota bacterium]|nr:hypothetical protein [Nitrospinota bacterium]